MTLTEKWRVASRYGYNLALTVLVTNQIKSTFQVDTPHRGAYTLLNKGHYRDRVIRDAIQSTAELVVSEQQKMEELSLGQVWINK